MSRPTPVPEPRPRVQGRTASTLLGLLLPLAILGVSAAIASTWFDDLPDPVATHWGADGVDGVSSLSFALVPNVIGAVLVFGFWALAFWWGRSASIRRIANATSVWVAILFAGILLGTLNAQRGLADAYEVGEVGGVIIVALLSASALGVVVGLITPADEPAPAQIAPPAGAARIPLSDSERAVWVARATSGPGVIIGSVTLVVLTVVAILVGDSWLLAMPVIVGLTLAAMLAWNVRADASGLTVRSVLGFPRSHQPIDEITSAAVVTVHALREFGGWGWRVGKDGRTGVVLRSGEALEVTQTAGRKFVVTVDDAASAAALLNTYADRRRSTR